MSDNKRVDKSLRSAWPPGTFDAAKPTHQEQPSRTQVYDAPPRGKAKRPKPKQASQ